jgi:U3 small nucleolar ribonucleoprotein component
MILKDTPVISTEGVEKLLREAEEATKTKTKRKGKQRFKRGKKKAELNEEESETSTDDDIEDLDASRPELFDCIEVAKHWL